MASSAAYGLRRWLESTSQPATQAEPPPDHLISQIGFTIASRRTTVTVGSLMAAEFIFEHGTEEHKEAIRRFTSQMVSATYLRNSVTIANATTPTKSPNSDSRALD